MAALALAAGCAGPEPLLEADCGRGTCDTPDDLANQICQVVCDGEQNEETSASTLGRGYTDRLAEYQALKASVRKRRAAQLVKVTEDTSAAGLCVAECRQEEAVDHCEARRTEAVKDVQPAFKEDYLRWACADVADVTNAGTSDSRGQEYCEYFAMVRLPDDEAHTVLGQNSADGATSSPRLLWSAQQHAKLAKAGSDVIGQCVFTTWHSDVVQPLGVCAGDDTKCPTLEYASGQRLAPWMSADTGIKIDRANMQMKVEFNSNSAASDLVSRCVEEPLSAEQFDDLYVRGCMRAYDLYETEWRRSDSEVCVVGARLAECGCKIEVYDPEDPSKVVQTITQPLDVGFAVVPPQQALQEQLDAAAFQTELPAQTVTLRGFQLGNWQAIDSLDDGCRLVDTGDYFPSGKPMRNIVACDLTASDLMTRATFDRDTRTGVAEDVKEICKSKYGNNVVVHVPIPGPGNSGDYLPIPNARVVCDEEACGSSTPWAMTEADLASTGDESP